MKILKPQLARRFIAAMLAGLAVIGLGAVAVHAPAQSHNGPAYSLKNIQTDKATQGYLIALPGGLACVERVMPETGEGKAALENLKLVAQRLDS